MIAAALVSTDLPPCSHRCTSGGDSRVVECVGSVLGLLLTVLEVLERLEVRGSSLGTPLDHLEHLGHLDHPTTLDNLEHLSTLATSALIIS